jgi:hypothetical protein
LDSQPTIQSHKQPLNDSPDPLRTIGAGPADKLLFAFLLVDCRDGCCAHVELTFRLCASLGEQNGDLSDFGHTDHMEVIGDRQAITELRQALERTSELRGGFPIPNKQPRMQTSSIRSWPWSKLCPESSRRT